MDSRLSVEELLKEADIIKESCFLSMKASSPFLIQESRNSSSSIVYFAFPGVWSIDDWKPTPAPSSSDFSFFPSLKGIGSNEIAFLNGSFLRRFLNILRTSALKREVDKAVSERKQIVMTGHSSGGSIAVIATVWLLEQVWKLNDQLPVCVTFGSPLVGDSIFCHALSREGWSHCFFHFVLRYDIIPRISLAPIESIEQEFQTILPFLDPKPPHFDINAIGRSQAESFFTTVLRNASLVANHRACLSMDCTNMLLEALHGFIKFSPFRPVGTYVFCTGNGRLVIVKNSDAVLQLLSYCLQLGTEQDLPEVAYRSLKEHLAYELELQESLEMQDIVFLRQLEELPHALKEGSSNELQQVDITLKDLGLSMEAKLCLCAAGEAEKHKLRNQHRIQASYRKIQDALNMLDNYKKTCEKRGVGYYDAFKLQKDTEDFNANLRRLELAGLWDEIIEMLKRYELPDNFERSVEWVELGTRYRCLVEPLDIANYYRHFLNEDTGPYIVNGRPRRYKYTQRWLEHDQLRTGITAWSTIDSCKWAKHEELRSGSAK